MRPLQAGLTSKAGRGGIEKRKKFLAIFKTNFSTRNSISSGKSASFLKRKGNVTFTSDFVIIWEGYSMLPALYSHSFDFTFRLYYCTVCSVLLHRGVSLSFRLCAPLSILYLALCIVLMLPVLFMRCVTVFWWFPVSFLTFKRVDILIQIIKHQWKSVKILYRAYMKVFAYIFKSRLLVFSIHCARIPDLLLVCSS